MAEIILADKAGTYSKEKQVLEAELAKALYNTFNQGDALSNLQKLAMRCIKRMLVGVEKAAEPARRQKAENALNSACKIESKLSVWNKIGPASVEGLKVFSQFETFDASDVSDIIRLFGQWVEGEENIPEDDPRRKTIPGGGARIPGGAARRGLEGDDEKDAWGKSLTPSFAVKDAYRPGVMGTHHDIPGDFWKNEVENVWADGKGRFKGFSERRRDRADGKFGVEGHVDLRRDKSEFAGMQGKRAQQDSNILKIDRMLGLIVACDISGTTADTVFALEMLGSDFLSAEYYMLPLATIVHKNHHSLLEVALALTLNGVIDYNIGFYSSLLPDSVRTVAREFPGLKALLQQYEKDRRNRFFATYYSPSNGLAGGYLFSQTEANRRRSCFNAKKLLAEAPKFPRYPMVETVCNWFDIQTLSFNTLPRR